MSNIQYHERGFMFANRKTLITTVLTLGSLLWITPSAALGQDQTDFSSASLEFSAASARGDYAIVGTFGANVGRELGRQKLDGLGNFTGSSTVNVPGSNGERILLEVTFTGTYTIDSDGIGVASFTVTFPNGSTSSGVEDFIITKAQIIDGVPIATEIVSASREPSAAVPGGIFLTHTYTRLPNRSEGGHHR
jgi:hypothetical protein